MKLTIFHGGGIGPQDITIPNQPTDNTNPGVIPGGTTYPVQPTDSVVLLDTSNGLVAQAQLKAGTYVGETHTFVWFNWNVSEVPPVVLGPGGNILMPFSGMAAGGVAGLVASSAITTPGAGYTLKWSGTYWVTP